MALVTNKGVFDKKKNEHGNIQDTDLVVPSGTMPSTDQDFVQRAAVRDTHSNRHAINPHRFNDAFSMLMGFPDGTPIKVSYYHREDPNVGIGSISGDVDFSQHAIHEDFTKIHDFEIRLTDPVQESPDDETPNIRISFEIVTYPGFIPTPGDIFLMDIGDGNVGVCELSEVIRTSYRHGTYFRSSVEVSSKLNEQTLNFLEKRVGEELYFDKNTYFNNDFTFLKYSSYKDLETLQDLLTAMTQWYFDKYYVPDGRSIFRPDGVYDKFVVDFLRKLVTPPRRKHRLVQLMPRLLGYEESVWYWIMDSSHLSFVNLESTYHIKKNVKGVFDVDLNYLLNKVCVDMGSCGKSMSDNFSPGERDENGGYPYVFSKAFYEEDSEEMDLVESAIYKARLMGKINPKEVIKLCSDYAKLEPHTSFYYIPVLIFLAKQSIRTLTYSENMSRF